jgi:hypothetical protein
MSSPATLGPLHSYIVCNHPLPLIITQESVAPYELPQTKETQPTAMTSNVRTLAAHFPNEIGHKSLELE